jgi:hypothetical protein
MIIDCARKQVTLTPWGEGKVMYVGLQARSLPPTISAVQARKLIIGDDQVFLAFVVAPTKQAKRNLEDNFVVYEYHMSFRHTTLDYHHKERWSLGLSVC